jgi:SAM-dependent methyltransferase
MNAVGHAASPARGLAEMLVGNQIQQAIHVAARLGFAELLEAGPASAEDLAARTGADPDAAFRLLRALTGFGLFTQEGERCFGLAPAGALLSADHPHSIKPFALWSGGVSYRAFGGLEETVRSGRPAFERIFGEEFFHYLGRHPESGAMFDEMMSRHTRPIVAAIARRGLDDAGTIVDVGGGRGEVLAGLLGDHPHVRGVLVEQSRLRQAALDTFAAAGVGDRCEIVIADIFDRLPSGDAYVLKSLVHGLGDDDAIRLLANCRHAMRGDGVVLLVEMLMPDDDRPSPSRLMDLLMLVGCHGRERTADEMRELLDAAGLGLEAIGEAKNGYAIIEARRAVAR